MKKALFLMAATWLSVAGFAQQDTIKNTMDTALKPQTDTLKIAEPDTIRVGNFVIIKGHKNGETNPEKGKTFTVIIRSSRHAYDTINNYHRSAFTTNWLVFDLGFANYNDRTDYASVTGSPYLHIVSGEAPFSKSDLKLQTKSSNVNIWLFLQRLNVAGNVLNLKYGLGVEMFNFRYDNNISYNKTPTYIFRDSINFSKDKLYAAYATIPLMININPLPDKKIFSVSFGASAGYLIGSHTKQKSDERGKDKLRGNLDLDKWRLAYVGELSLGPVKLYGSYSVHPLHDNTLKQYPYAIGIRFSGW